MKNMICSACVMIMMSLTPFEICALNEAPEGVGAAPVSQTWSATPVGQAWLTTPDGQAWSAAPDGQAWLATPNGQAWSAQR
ncbi:hypothetical protein FACS1894122_11520 [Alphaproteobacteria bacterium]|nr:hypothetical protein FACS1894122_11520 [Alphaproteobacteria bacterium]